MASQREIKKMTRRSVLFSPIAATAARADVAEHLNRMTTREGLGIIGDVLNVTAAQVPVPEALTTAGHELGPLTIVDQAYTLSFSPDGYWVAWCPINRDLRQIPTEFEVCFANSSRSVRRLRLSGTMGEHATISSAARHLALVVHAGPTSRQRLIVVNPSTAEIETDLSDAISRFGSSRIERLRISGDGRLVVVGYTGSLAVVDVPSRAVIYESVGACASIAADGRVVAFVKDDQLITSHLGSNSNRRMVSHWYTTRGVGAWSPDGAFLLAGIRSLVGFFTHLAAIQSTTGEIVDLMRLGEGDSGCDWAWIRRTLLLA